MNPSILHLDTPFDEATTTEPLGNGAYAVTIDGDWSAPLGPNGGYLAAIVLRAMAHATADAARAPRSLTLHYLRPPKAGPALLDVVVERTGRSLTSLSARMHQDGGLCVLALGAFAVDFPSAIDYAEPAPQTPRPEDVEPIALHPAMPPIAHRFEVRPSVGPALFSEADEALTGGWMRLREPRLADALALALYTDAWLPAPWARLSAPVPAPTIDLTIHFRHRMPLEGAQPDDPVLGVFRSATSAEGFSDEDAAIYSRDGVLLAQARQLALLRPARPSE